MTKVVQQTVARSISRKREQTATLREELEDLDDCLETRVNDDGKPCLSHAEAQKTLRLEKTQPTNREL